MHPPSGEDRLAKRQQSSRGMKGRRTAIVALAATLLASGAAAAECTLHTVAELPVTMVDMKPIVAAKINGADARFAVDSGAFYSQITPASASQYGLSLAPTDMFSRGFGGYAREYVARVNSFTIAGTTAKNVDFLSGGGEVGAGAAGVLGQNILRATDVEYDLANGVVRLTRPTGCGSDALAYWAKSATFSAMPLIDSHERWPLTQGNASVNGVKILVTFDTGAFSSVVSLAAAKRAGINLTDPGVVPAGTIRGIGKRQVQTWIAPVDSFVIGGEEIRHTRLRIESESPPGADMNIGADFFLSHRVYVANSQHRIYFTYNGGPVFDLSTKTQTPSAPSSAAAAATTADSATTTPTDAEGFGRRGTAFAARRDYDHAIADLTRACELAPREPRYFYQRGLARMRNRQSALAMGDFDKALELKPDDVDALTARAQLRLAGGDKAEAVTDLEAASKAQAKEADGRFVLGELYLAADAPPAAIGEFDLWIKAHPDDSRRTDALAGRCAARALTGEDLAKGLDDCNATLRVNGKYARALDGRGLIRLRQGDFDKAIADFDAALAVSPKMALALYGRGAAKLKKGATADGNADIAAATAQTPKVAELAKQWGVSP
jgi:tetratricopeptide (TPR) repeat protein/predicted aspartyl protease